MCLCNVHMHTSVCSCVCLHTMCLCPFVDAHMCEHLVYVCVGQCVCLCAGM